MIAPPHPRQPERLAALYSYEVLDTDREKPFDEIVALASQLCGTPISVINLIDAERQWFKAEVGIGARETPLESSLCSHAILESEFVEINDTRTDPRMADNPLVCGDPGLQFYAGALLMSDEGLPIGTLCVLGTEPKILTPLQRDALRVLARQVMSQLDLRRALKRAEVMRQEVDHRVKNSLQAVSSLTRLQGRAVKSDEAREALDLVQRRIGTVAALHEQLYRTNAGDMVGLRQYFSNITEFIAASFPENVTVDCYADDFMVTSEQAAALGVIMNEFATNSLKYAFPDGRDGTLSIRAERGMNGAARVDLRDDGPGLNGAGAADGSGIGLKIIDASVTQLGGSYCIHGDGPGLHASFEFPVGRQPRIGTTS